MSFSNIKVGVRLGLGFALVILAGLVVALLGRIELNSIDKEMSHLVNDRVVKVGQLNRIKDNLNEVAHAVNNIVASSNQQQMQAEKQKIEVIRNKTTPLMQTLSSSIQSADGRALMEKVRQIRDPYNANIDEIAAAALASYGEPVNAELLHKSRVLLVSYLEALDSIIALQEEKMSESAQIVQNATVFTGQLLLIIAGAAALMGALIAWVLTRSITRQLGGEPDYTASVVHEIASGNLAVEVQTQPGDSTSLLAEIKTMRDGLAKVVAHVREGSEAVASASTQISEGNQDLSGRTEEQASALQQTAASMEQLSSTVKQNADNARQANQLAQSASTVAIQGGNVVAQVVDTMKGINDSSKKIADIIGVIDSIAFQTNILALNAAVEAARAGEQGRGFAVVASEVRSLAGRSANAAKEIKELITDSVTRVEQGTSLVGQAGVTMSEVVNSIRRVTDIMGEISAASSEQSAGVSQVGEAVTQMDQTTQQNAALVEEMAAAAASLSTQAQDLVQTVAMFKLGKNYSATPRMQRSTTHAPTHSPNAKAAPVQHSATVGLAAPTRSGTHNTSSALKVPKAPKTSHSHTALPSGSASATVAKADNSMDDWESF